MSKSKSRGGESMFLTLLTVLFIGLKLTNYITWSWWWVLSPIWAPLGLVLGVITIVAFIPKRKPTDSDLLREMGKQWHRKKYHLDDN